MADTTNPLIDALTPLVTRVRRDVTAIKTATGRQAWTDEPLTRERLARHLNGGPARGVCPIEAGSTRTMVALLDFDSHGGETPWGEMAATAGGVVDTLALVWGCVPVAFRSSGGRGVHVYLLWPEPQDARSVRVWLRRVLADCGLRPGVRGLVAGEVEVFPKQDHVPETGKGSQFILPLAGASEWLEYCDLSGSLVPTGRPLSAEAWGFSVGVPEAPLPEPRAAVSDTVPEGEWREALDAIPNGAEGSEPLGYDDWRNVLFAIHAELGEVDGLPLAHEFSARSSKYDPDFLDTRVWPYITDREGGITGRTICSIAARYGWHAPLLVDAFPMMPLADAGPRGPDGTSEAPGKPGADLDPAQHDCSDLANAQRIRQASAGNILAMGGAFYVWDGARFAENGSDAFKAACKLSAMVAQEARDAHAKASELLAALDRDDSADIKALRKLADKTDDRALKEAVGAHVRAAALSDWSKQCEMKPRLDAALGVLAKQLNTPADDLDADPWALNTASGLVDLRTGALRPHATSSRVTKLAPVVYVPDADTSEWERVVRQITCEVDGPAPVAEFLQRWFGYCTSAVTREQVFVVHFGDGGNGKSLLLEAIADVIGDYANTAPAGMLTGVGAVKDTDAAILRGARMITAHESKAGAELKDDFVKLATGDDRISGRKLYGDPFTFSPTHKLQLLTNHRPVIRTQDYGIWRRIVLVSYGARFGDAAEVAAGRATAVADRTLAARLRTPEMRSQILAWLVRGAVEWARGGLQIPASVRLASHEYQREQDRVAEFVKDCCDLSDPAASEPLTLGMRGVYPTYTGWCKDAGTHPMSRQRLVLELKRLGHGETSGYETGERGRRRVTRIQGLRLMHPD